MAFLFSNNLPQKKLLGLIIFFIGLQLFIFAFSFLFVQLSGDVFVYFLHGSNILEGKIPYRDFPAYPPFSLIIFLLPRIFTSDFSLYGIIFSFQIFFINLICLLFVIRFAKETGENLFATLATYTLCLFLLFPLVSTRYDLFPATLTFLAFYFFIKNKKKIAWLFLILGGFTKIYPFFLMPLFFIFQLLKKEYKTLIQIGGIGVLGIIISFFVFGTKNFFSIFFAQLERPLQIETFFSSFLLIAQFLGFLSLKKEVLASVNVRSLEADFLAKYSPFFIFFALFLVYGIYFRELKRCKEKNGFSNFPFSNYFLVTILVSLILNKVFSPQFLLWLCPFVPFIKGKWCKFFIWFFVFACLLTTIIYPFGYIDLYLGKFYMIFLLLVRNLLLFFMVYFSLNWKITPVKTESFYD